MKFVKWFLLSIVAVAVILCLSFFAYLVLFVDPDQYKDRLLARLEQKYGLFVVMSGKLDWQFYPYLGLGVEDVYLSAKADRNPDHKLAELDKVLINVHFLSLLKREIKIDALHLDGLKLHFVVDAEGQANWSRFMASNPSLSQDKTLTDSAVPKDNSNDSNDNNNDSVSNGKAFAIEISKLSLSNAEFVFVNKGRELTYSLRRIYAAATDIAVDKPFPLEIRADFVNQHLGMAVHDMRLSSSIFYDTAGSKLRLNDLKLSLSLLYESMLVQPLDLVFTSQLTYDLNQRLVNLINARLAFADSVLRSELAVRFDEQLSYQGPISLGPLRPRKTLAWFRAADQMRFPEKTLQFASLHTEVSGNLKQMSLSNMLVIFDKARLTGDLTYSFADTKGIKANLNLSDLNLDAYFPPQKKAKKQKTKQRKVKQQEVKQQEVKQETDAVGESSESDRLEHAARQSEEPEALYTNKPVLPLDLLKAYDADIHLYIDNLVYNRVNAHHLDMELVLQQGKLDLNKLNAEMFEGTVKLRGLADFNQTSPELTLVHEFTGINSALVAALLDQPLFAGKLFASGKYSTQGNSLTDWFGHLNGTAEISMTDGVLLDINTDKLACEAVAFINSNKFANNLASAHTRFTDFKAGFLITDGLVENKNLVLTTEHTQVTGEGSIDLLQQQFAYELALQLTGNTQACTLEAQLGEIKLNEIKLPVHCSGHFKDAPAKFCSINRDKLADQLKDVLSEALNQKLNQNCKFMQLNTRILTMTCS